MEMIRFADDGLNDAITLCPCCGGTNYDDNRISERLYIEVA